jgi:protein-disulfide isomerase
LLAATVLAFAAGPGRPAAAADKAAAADTASAFTAAQKEELNKVIHDYLLKNPDVVVESLNAAQNKQRDDEAKAFKQNIIKYKDQIYSKDTPIGGNPNGTKTIVEFFDYNCGYCKRAVDDVVNIVKEDGNVKVYFKDMPILAASSNDAAYWAQAAGKQGKYYEFHVALMKSSLPREKETYKKIGQDLKLDVDKLQKDAEGDKSIRDTVEKNLELARNLGIHGTPGFIINGVLYPGYLGLDTMKKVIADGAPANDAGGK